MGLIQVWLYISVFWPVRFDHLIWTKTFATFCCPCTWNGYLLWACSIIVVTLWKHNVGLSFFCYSFGYIYIYIQREREICFAIMAHKFKFYFWHSDFVSLKWIGHVFDSVQTLTWLCFNIFGWSMNINEFISVFSSYIFRVN